MKGRCVVHRLGQVPYRQAWQMQDDLAAEIAAGARPPTLLLLEHPHTYTFGRSGQAQNLLWDAAELRRREVEVHWVDRGGDVTYHGPGQLVGYPLLPLAPLDFHTLQQSGRLPQADYVGYLRNLESVLIQALADLAVPSLRVPGYTGVWVQPGRKVSGDPRPAKIAAIGVKVDARGISRHGFALNVKPDMTYWQGIIGCGLQDAQMTSLAELLDPPPAIEQVLQPIIRAFGGVFGYEMMEAEDGGRQNRPAGPR